MNDSHNLCRCLVKHNILIGHEDFVYPPSEKTHLGHRDNMEMWSWYEAVYSLSLDFRFPVTACLVYVGLVQVGNYCNSKKPGVESRAAPVKPKEYWIILHNVLLCVYSAAAFWYSLKLVMDHFQQSPVLQALVDADQRVLDSGMDFIAWTFYLSKYYEFMDSFILWYKGKPISFLQTYHHVGAVMTMWYILATRLVGIWIWPVFNGFIHTIMYFYYALSAAKIKVSWKRAVTRLQLLQFMTGGVILNGFFVFHPMAYAGRSGAPPVEDVVGRFFGWDWPTSSWVAATIMYIYNFALVLLFWDFSKKTYHKTGNPNIKEN